MALPQHIKNKLDSFCDVKHEAVIESRDVETLYQIPLLLQEQNMDQIVCDYLGLSDLPQADMTEWKALVEKVQSLEKTTNIALFGKNVELQDAYRSEAEAKKTAG